MNSVRVALAGGLELALGLALWATSAGALVSVIPLAREGQTAPGGNGVFPDYARYGEPCLNNASQCSFWSRLTDTAGGATDDAVQARVNADLSVTLLVREGQPIPDGTGFFGALNTATRQYAMNDSGRVAIVASLTGTPGGAADNVGLYSIRDPGLFWVHARRGDPAPETGSNFGILYPPQINNQPPPAIAFHASLGTGTLPSTIYVSRLGLLSLVSFWGQPAPDAFDPQPQPTPDGINGTVFSYPSGDPPALRKNAAEVAVWAHLFGTHDAARDDDGIFRASADEFTDFARGNQPAPGGGTYGEFTSPVYNANGVAAFAVDLAPFPSSGSILALDWPFGGDLVAYTGQPAADGDGIFTGFGFPALNDSEAVAFRVSLGGTAGGTLDDVAIYKGDSLLIVVPSLEDQLAREGQPVPEGGGVFNDFGPNVAINNSGQVLFTATLRGTPGGTSDDRGLYLWDPIEGLTKLVREGDVVDGRTVVAFSTLTQRDFGGYRVLNDLGEAVARVDFAQVGGDGVYLFRFQRTTSVLGTGPPSLKLSLGPNPSRGRPVMLRYALPKAGPLMVTAHDLTGRRVRTVYRGIAGSAGTLAWDVADDSGNPLPPGVYFVRIEAAAQAVTRRLVCLR